MNYSIKDILDVHSAFETYKKMDWQLWMALKDGEITQEEYLDIEKDIRTTFRERVNEILSD